MPLELMFFCISPVCYFFDFLLNSEAGVSRHDFDWEMHMFLIIFVFFNDFSGFLWDSYFLHVSRMSCVSAF